MAMNQSIDQSILNHSIKPFLAFLTKEGSCVGPVAGSADLRLHICIRPGKKLQFLSCTSCLEIIETSVKFFSQNVTRNILLAS